MVKLVGFFAALATSAIAVETEQTFCDNFPDDEYCARLEKTLFTLNVLDTDNDGVV